MVSDKEIFKGLSIVIQVKSNKPLSGNNFDPGDMNNQSRGLF